MKNCNKCSVELVVGENWAPSMEKNSTFKCKSCIKEYDKHHRLKNPGVTKQYNLNQKDGLFYVYLRQDQYVGVTNNLYSRQSRHKQILCILHSTPNVSDASELEELLHDMGYKGKGKKTYEQTYLANSK